MHIARHTFGNIYGDSIPIQMCKSYIVIVTLQLVQTISRILSIKIQMMH